MPSLTVQILDYSYNCWKAYAYQPSKTCLKQLLHSSELSLHQNAALSVPPSAWGTEVVRSQILWVWWMVNLCDWFSSEKLWDSNQLWVCCFIRFNKSILLCLNLHFQFLLLLAQKLSVISSHWIGACRFAWIFLLIPSQVNPIIT